MSLTIDQAFDEFNSSLENIKNIGGTIYQDLDNLAYTIRQLAPYDKGRLRNSIQLLVEKDGSDLSVYFEMVNYGYYQAFGVNGRQGIREPIRELRSTNADRIAPYGVEEIEATPFTYNKRKFGLPATQFLNIQQTRDQVAAIVEQGFLNILDA